MAAGRTLPRHPFELSAPVRIGGMDVDDKSEAPREAVEVEALAGDGVDLFVEQPASICGRAGGSSRQQQ
jgi:hypothetical protein